jgi:hypothetical protein
MRYLTLLLAILVLSISLVGCKTGPKANPEALAACKDKAKDADACKNKKCCNEAGASGHMFMTGSGCKCL